MEQLGIDWRLFVLQLINFGIIFVLLVALLKKPLARVLKERSDRIETSLKEAAKIKEELAQIEERKEKELAQSKEDSQKMLQHSQKVAQDIEKKAQQEAQRRAEELVAKARQEIEKQKDQLKLDLKDDLAALVKESIASSLSNLTADEQKAMTARAIAELKKSVTKQESA